MTALKLTEAQARALLVANGVIESSRGVGERGGVVQGGLRARAALDKAVALGLCVITHESSERVQGFRRQRAYTTVAHFDFTPAGRAALEAHEAKR